MVFWLCGIGATDPALCSLPAHPQPEQCLADRFVAGELRGDPLLGGHASQQVQRPDAGGFANLTRAAAHQLAQRLAALGIDGDMDGVGPPGAGGQAGHPLEI